MVELVYEEDDREPELGQEPVIELDFVPDQEEEVQESDDIWEEARGLIQ